MKKPVALIVMDGWGIAPPSDSNGVSLAKTPNFDRYLAQYPAMTLMASGEAVGLSWGEMGNSEVGHLNLGTGKVFYQNLPRIDKSIRDESFFDNKELIKACEHVKTNKSKLHIMGLVSQGRVHGMLEHLYALLELAKKQKIKKVYIHGFLDGRDTIYNSGKGFVEELEKAIKKIKVGEIATLSGRFYAMDRDNHWERVEKAYKAIVKGESEEYYKDPIKAIEASYNKKVYDEEFLPTVIGKEGKPTAVVEDGDAVIFANYRSDRARQISKAFVLPEFEQFERGKKISNLHFVGMMEYEAGLPMKVAFPKEIVKTSLPQIISDKGLKQLHIAETEKYAHVTFFFSGGKEKAFEGEERVVIPSPRVQSYADKPEMSALKIKKRLVQEIMKDKHDFIVVNFANPDMVSHTADIKATVKAVETVDKCLGEVVDLILSKGGVAFVTADHGNAEELKNLQTGEKDKEHSTNPVPALIIGKQFEGLSAKNVELVGNDLSLLQPVGILADVAPTLLKIMDIKEPKEMTGKSLI